MTECTICHRRADHFACDACLQRLYADLREVTIQYRRLDPSPRSTLDNAGRRSPGFRSQSPGDDHVIALRDRRTRAKVKGDLQNAHTFMADWLAVVQFERGMALRSPVSIEAAYFALLANQDWIGRQEWVWELAMGTRGVLAQLRTANGDKPPTRIATCPECEVGDLLLIEGVVDCQSCSYCASAAALLEEHFGVTEAA
jgi:hypothetical protein